MGYEIYVLKSEKDGKYYIGQTNNLIERIEKHRRGEVISTKNRRPLKLIHQELYKTRSESVKRESYLKSLKGGNEWKKLIQQWGVAKW